MQCFNSEESSSVAKISKKNNIQSKKQTKKQMPCHYNDWSARNNNPQYMIVI